MYVNVLSTYSDKKSCHTSTLYKPASRGLSAIAELLVCNYIKIVLWKMSNVPKPKRLKQIGNAKSSSKSTVSCTYGSLWEYGTFVKQWLIHSLCDLLTFAIINNWANLQLPLEMQKQKGIQLQGCFAPWSPPGFCICMYPWTPAGGSAPIHPL